MSRIGKSPVVLGDKIKALVSGELLTVEGPGGSLKLVIDPMVEITIADKKLTVTRKGETQVHRERHGLMRTLVANMVHGVGTPFRKELQIIGVGYGALVKGQELVLNLGYSHPVNFGLPKGVSAAVEKQTLVILSSADRGLLGETAARMRKLRPVEPYKGKGVRYLNEVVKKKVGKSAVTGGAKA